MDAEGDGQMENTILIGAAGCAVFGVLLIVVGMLLWWAITGVVPTFGLFGA